MEIWGGVECTINRVGDAYFNQLSRSGHDKRVQDLDLFRELGVRTLRFPVLWEHYAASSLHAIDWSDARERLERARDLGIRVIVGFTHHGSGPRYTDLLDKDYPEKLACFARAFAEEFPWVEAYTPVNEPLTTARFSGLYGAWYPHRKDTQSFLRMLLHQCQAVRLCMRTIREVTPDARLIQTEDLGKVFSTRFLAYQAEFENHRRWLSFDLLLGRIKEGHALHAFCLDNGLAAWELEEASEQPCVPNILGINHYITSNRFLDERIERYPPHLHGGNGRHKYADIEAVRVGGETVCSLASLLWECWDRYELPLAVTESHLGCTREDQMRWLKESWDQVRQVAKEGIDVQALTAWSLLGAFDWNSLVTRDEGNYESGVFDLRAPEPRATQLTQMIKSFAKEEDFDHPALDSDGWWHRPERVLYPSQDGKGDVARPNPRIPQENPREILITGSPGKLALAFSYTCERRSLAFRLLTEEELDLRDASAVRDYLAEIRPWAIIHAAGYPNELSGPSEYEGSDEEQLIRAQNLAGFCADHGVKFLNFSSEEVFGPSEGKLLSEFDETAPGHASALSQVAVENWLKESCPRALTLRTSRLFGPWDEDNILSRSLKIIGRGDYCYLNSEAILAPTYIPDFCDNALDLFLDDESGIWHLTNEEGVNDFDFVRSAAESLGLDSSLLLPERSRHLQSSRQAVMISRRGGLMRGLEPALDDYLRECRLRLS